MDDLLKIASDVMETFNPETDSADDYEKLPDDEYNCLLEEVTNKQNEKGTVWISFKFSISDGKYANRIIFVNYYFTEKTTERSIKSLIKVAHDFGYELPIEAFGGMDTLTEALQGLSGNTALVKQTTSKNDFTNYKVTPTE